MECNLRFFQLYAWRRMNGYYIDAGCWFRIFGWGLHFSNRPLHFTDITSKRRFIKLPFRYKVALLRRGK